MADQIVSLVRNPASERLLAFESDYGLVLQRQGHSGSRYLVAYAHDILEQFAAVLRDECDGEVLAYRVERGVVHITYLGRSSQVRAKRNHRICFDLLRAFNSVLADAYEIRAMTFRKEEGFETFVLARTGTWAAAEQAEDVSGQFEKIGPTSGFVLDRYPWVVALALERVAIASSRLLAGGALRLVLRRR